jgi:hypothetical protein
MMEDSQGRSTNRIATSNKFKLGDRINHVGLHSSQIEETEEADLLEVCFSFMINMQRCLFQQNPALGDDDKIAEFQTEVDRLITFRAKNGYANDYESEQVCFNS